MDNALDAGWLAERIPDRTIKGIALETAALIGSGAIPVGARLPAVRDLARLLDVSPATVSAAWGQLRRQKVITGTGRNGVWVCGNIVTPRPVRFEAIGNFGDNIIADLTLAAPDPAYLPSLRQALAQGGRAVNLNSYRREPISQVLRQAIEPRWPYAAEAFLAADGGFDAMYQTLQTLILPGTPVAIEDPTATRLLDMLDNVGANIIAVPCDDEGPTADGLRAALKHNPAVFIYQPRTHSTTGHTVSARRADEMARLLRDGQTLVIEDDGIGELSEHQVHSLGRVFPQRTVHVRSFSKAYGPDLRLAVISSSGDIIRRIQSVRNFGASWTSRILQEAVAWMMEDTTTQQAIVAARRCYAQRRRALVRALAQRGITLPDRDGLSIQIPVPSEQYALVTLAAHGIAVMPGKRHSIGPSQFIRVSTSLLEADRVELVADALQLACRHDDDSAVQ
ncbi:aminotransferase class I/II-fold pyridoxal phosphate-dependent enzyme [Acerihabitans arboris]|uniref:Aminotransferase class I/II-fold pyridoxal phosphate-dependent enzyme n=1 Tax=Acerihabitans arboris TaxID=2691583 RepID=A0A845SI14_9GAMM|nr:aminotransferase class I/II-fold pyridoxal phosphate-dependent enzyme [Acerihabitans arboris]NDL62686.1 aminotransferase class I/II-fold pyridoxal phosphate-dependent enzyme [Acerihabitans arboris]